MLLFQKIIVFDFETDGTNPSECNPVQLAAVAIDYNKMEIIPMSEFCSYMKPPGIDDREQYIQEHQSTITFHAQNYQCTTEDIVNKWANAPDSKMVWNSFVNYAKRFKVKNSFGKLANPIPCGANIIGFDLEIVDRLNTKYKTGSKVFHTQRVLDITQMLFSWLAASNLDSVSMDTLREHLGIETQGSHDAMKDVKDCAKIGMRLLQFQKTLAEKRNFFKGAFHD